MSKPLNQIELGTSCIVKESGQEGTLQRIFHYPTKFLVKTNDGEFQYYSTHEISFDGYERSKTSLSIPDIPYDGVGSSYSVWVPFQAESQVEHHFLSSKEIVWEMITSLEMYNIWFAGIQRAVADVDTDRYVHKFSFDKMDLKPGSFFKIRPATLAPWFRCRIITVEKEKEFGFDFKMTPFYSEYISFRLEESKNGVFVTCNRFSKGPFSFLSLLGWNKTNSKILQKLADITPVIEITSVNESEEGQIDSAESRAYNVAFVVNKALDGDMDPLNNTSDVITRGKAKAMLIKIKRGTAERPPIPDKVDSAPLAPPSGKAPTKSTASSQLSKDEQVALVVNQVLDGNKEAVDAIDDKVIRAKAKAMLVKIKRGSAERPPMPDVSTSVQPESVDTESDLTPDQIFAIAVNKAVAGDMEAVNAIDDKVTRGKAKALLVKIKRGTAEAPPMPELSGARPATEASDSKAEPEDEMKERLIADGLNGNMEEINALDNKVLRGKIKAAIVKAKRNK